YPDDVETYNRLGKALMELGRNKEAVEAFRQAIHYSPYNSIAQKNLDRLKQMGESVVRASAKPTAAPQAFIEESGKSARTLLLNLAPAKIRLKLSPGDPLDLEVKGGAINVTDTDGTYIGIVEPRLAARIVKLIKGGNRYQAAVTAVNQTELGIIVREVFKHPSQAGIVSFPSRTGQEIKIAPAGVIDYELGEDDVDESDQTATVKDWSDDDTEPGDDEAYSPVLHRIINADGEDDAAEEDNSQSDEF
ncbi:MAG: tetratricopeptide repeat protein, partial [SAR202 cluster bacterium]|nr:tetratricopeptide repeat protein [SAR202 cluster bacterium]